jgi:hypothetical protein
MLTGDNGPQKYTKQLPTEAGSLRQGATPQGTIPRNEIHCKPYFEATCCCGRAFKVRQTCICLLTLY